MEKEVSLNKKESRLKNFLAKESCKKVYGSVACVALGIFIGFLIMVALAPKEAPFDFLMLISGGLYYYGPEGFGNILAVMAPLLVCGIGIIFAYKSGVFNIGLAGQYIMGMFGALMFAIICKANWSVCILMAIIFGALWGLIPGLLKVFCHVNEVISGIMLNWIALLFVNYSMQTYLSDMVDPGNSFQTQIFWYNEYGPALNPGGKLPNFGVTSLGENFSIAFLIAIIVAILAFVILNKTTFGYQLKASGLNDNASRYAGINPKRNAIITMAISGGLAGLGASLYYLSGMECWGSTVSTYLPQLPWNGILVAFICQMNPIGGVFTALFIALISNGSTATSQSIFPKEIADLITSIIVYLSGLSAMAIRFIPTIKERVKLRKEAKLLAKNNVSSINANKEGK